MSNKTVLERLLLEINDYERNRSDRNAFAQRFVDAIEALERVPYSVNTAARDWQYKIETEGYFEEEGFESEIEVVIPKLKEWVNSLIETFS